MAEQYQPRFGMIFDVDGTMWDSRAIVAGAWNRVLERYGFEPKLTAELLTSEFGKPLDEIGVDLVPEANPEILAKMLPEWFEEEEADLRKEMPYIYDGLEDALQTLSQRYPLFIVSNAQSGYIELFLEKTGFGNYFRGFVSNGDTGLPKDGNIRLIMDRYHLTDAVYVGDTQADGDCTRRARAKFAYASYGFGKTSDYDYYLESPRDLVKHNFSPDY